MSVRRLQILLALTAIAAAIVMVGAFSTGLRLACLAVAAAGVALTASERLRPGGGWWSLLAGGLMLGLAGLAISVPEQTIGGIVAIVGSGLMIFGAAIGFPAE